MRNRRMESNDLNYIYEELLKFQVYIIVLKIMEKIEKF